MRDGGASPRMARRLQTASIPSPLPMVSIMKQPIKTAIDIRRLTAMAVFAALMIALQVAMSFLPNIELVSLLIILAVVHLGHRAFWPIGVFILVEGLIYGFGLWWVNYLYVWPLLALVTLALRRFSHPLLWAVVSGLFGLLFGSLCALPYFITGGWGAGIGYIVGGIPFDITHCIGNVALALLLFYPLDLVLKKVLK